MTCAKCNAAVSLEDSTPHEGEGRFREEYQCAHGHTGVVTGKEEEPASRWDRYGSVFQA